MIPLLAWLFGLAALGALAWAIAAARQLLYPRALPVPPLAAEPSLDVHTLTTSDGSPVPLRVLSCAAPRGRVLLFHGYFASSRQVLDIADGLRGRGYEALVMELRGHGERPGPCTLGLRETEDALAVIAWAEGHAPLPLGVLGLSMGASVACHLAARAPQVAAVVLDSPYSRLYPVFARALWQRYALPLPAVWVLWWGAQLWLRRRLAGFDPVLVAPAVRQPLLMIQGGEDRRVVPRLSGELYRAWAGPKTRWFEPLIAHVGMFAHHPREYLDRVAAFFDAHLAKRVEP